MRDTKIPREQYLGIFYGVRRGVPVGTRVGDACGMAGCVSVGIVSVGVSVAPVSSRGEDAKREGFFTMRERLSIAFHFRIHSLIG